MTFKLLSLDGLFGTDDPCLDTVLPAADWGTQHPDEIGRAISMAVTAPLGIGAAMRTETTLDSARTLGDWAGTIGDQTDFNHQLGAWAGAPLAAASAWGACHVGNVIDGWGSSASDGAHPSVVSDAWSAPADPGGASLGVYPTPASAWSAPPVVDAPTALATMDGWQAHMAGGPGPSGTSDIASSSTWSGPTNAGSSTPSGGVVSDAGGSSSSGSGAASAGSSASSGGI